MDKKNTELLEEAMKLESNMSDLYRLYKESFAQDKKFWRKMAQEESNHESLLKLAQEFFSFFPEEIVYKDLAELQKINKDIFDTIERYKKQLPSREECYRYAINMEKSSYEFHYQQMVTQPSGSMRIRTLQKLNLDDKDHYKRIEELFEKGRK